MRCPSIYLSVFFGSYFVFEQHLRLYLDWYVWTELVYSVRSCILWIKPNTLLRQEEDCLVEITNPRTLATVWLTRQVTIVHVCFDFAIQIRNRPFFVLQIYAWCVRISGLLADKKKTKQNETTESLHGVSTDDPRLALCSQMLEYTRCISMN